MSIENVALIAGAIAWITTAVVAKSGPVNILNIFRRFMNSILGENSPFSCFHCASFWVGLSVLLLFATGNTYVLLIIQLFGVLGIAQALRGASGEWN